MTKSGDVQRFCALAGAAVLAGALSGCGPSEPNQPGRSAGHRAGSSRAPTSPQPGGSPAQEMMPRQIMLAMSRFGGKPGVLSTVLLRDRASTMTRDDVAAAFKRVLGRNVTVDPLPGNAAIDGFTVDLQGVMFVVNRSRVPYVPPTGIAAFADQFSDGQTQRLVASHKAFVSLDSVVDSPEFIRDLMPIVTSLAGAFLDEATTALYSTFFRSAIPRTPQSEADFASGNVLGLFAAAAEADQIRVAQRGQAAMQKAIEEAKRTFPQFCEAWKNRSEQSTFMVKSRFAEGDRVEHMWSVVESVEGGVVTCTLANDPFKLVGVRKGHRHKVTLRELSDWVYASHGTGAGAFTDPALRQGMLGS